VVEIGDASADSALDSVGTKTTFELEAEILATSSELSDVRTSVNHPGRETVGPTEEPRARDPVGEPALVTALDGELTADDKDSDETMLDARMEDINV
jgi:hypothetical protein